MGAPEMHTADVRYPVTAYAILPRKDKQGFEVKDVAVYGLQTQPDGTCHVLIRRSVTKLGWAEYGKHVTFYEADSRKIASDRGSNE